MAARKSCTCRYGLVLGCAAGAAGAVAGAAGAVAGAAGAGETGFAGASLPSGSRKNRKNSEFGDSTMVVPVLSSAVP